MQLVELMSMNLLAAPISPHQELKCSVILLAFFGISRGGFFYFGNVHF